jgi:thioredoxin reductase
MGSESRFPEFPWSGAGPWDVDVAVVGAGPAGLAAAVRLRWLKTFPVVPVSVVLINSGPLGGLARLGNSILTGPSLAFPAGGLVERLTADLTAWPLPVIRTGVASVRQEGPIFVLDLEDGRELTAFSVIVATGMIDLRNLADFWGREVRATYGGRRRIYRLLEEAVAGREDAVVVGGTELLAMAPRIRAVNPAARLLVLGGTAGRSDTESTGLDVTFGRLDGAVSENGKLCGLLVQDPEGRAKRLDTGRVVIEFNSLELSHANPLPGTVPGAQGFIAADVHGNTGIEGLLAAGDCTGPPFSAAVAVGQGIEAAFSAYRRVFLAKFGKEAPLFAYFGDPSVAGGPEGEDFPILPGLVPVPLVEGPPIPEAKGIWPLLDGRNTVAELAQLTGEPEQETTRLLAQLIAARAITFLPMQAIT